MAFNASGPSFGLLVMMHYEKRLELPPALRLSGLQKLTAFEGKTYAELPANI